MGDVQGAASAEAPVFEDGDQLRRRLAKFLSSVSGSEVAIERLSKFPAGFSWITYAVQVAGFARAREVILRIGPPYGLFAPYSAMPEFNSLSALAASAVPAPRVFFGSDDPTILGAPFFICEKVEGDTPLPWGSQGQTMEGSRRESLAADFIDALAALHGFDWRTTRSRNGARASRTRTRRSSKSTIGRGGLSDGPCARIRWRTGLSPGSARTLRKPSTSRSFTATTGSAIFSNAMAEYPPILDWELVHLGDPIEDLGWAFLPQYRGGTSLVCGLADEADFIARYEAQSALKVDPASLKFYIVFSLMKLAFTHMAAARCFEDGLFNDMRMPAMATQIAPVFRQIAKTLEGTW